MAQSGLLSNAPTEVIERLAWCLEPADLRAFRLTCKQAEAQIFKVVGQRLFSTHVTNLMGSHLHDLEAIANHDQLRHFVKAIYIQDNFEEAAFGPCPNPAPLWPRDETNAICSKDIGVESLKAMLAAERFCLQTLRIEDSHGNHLATPGCATAFALARDVTEGLDLAIMSIGMRAEHSRKTEVTLNLSPQHFNKGVGFTMLRSAELEVSFGLTSYWTTKVLYGAPALQDLWISFKQPYQSHQIHDTFTASSTVRRLKNLHLAATGCSAHTLMCLLKDSRETLNGLSLSMPNLLGSTWRDLLAILGRDFPELTSFVIKFPSEGPMGRTALQSSIEQDSRPLKEGVVASPALWLGVASSFDTWTEEELAGPFIVYSALALSGLVLGPVAGGSIAEHGPHGWRQYTILVAGAIALPFLLATRETSKYTIIRRARLQLLPRRKLSTILYTSIVDPLATVFKNPALLVMAIYTGCILGTFYTICTAVPPIFATRYRFSPSQQGLVFLAMLIGTLLGSLCLLLNNALIYQPRLNTWKGSCDAEIENALFEEKLRRRNSRASTKVSKRKSNHSLLTSQNTSRLSLLSTSKKHNSTFSLNAITLDRTDKNFGLSIAAARYLNSVNERRILPERILFMLSKNPPYGELCAQLEWFGLRVDRVALAAVMLEALQNPEPAHSPAQADSPTCPEPTLANHEPARPDIVRSPSSYPTPPRTPVQTFTPPPFWRLWPVIAASVLIPASLFLSAWTLREGIHWIVPVLGMALFALGMAVVVASTTMFLFELSGADAVAGAGIVSWVLGAAGPVTGQLLVGGLDIEWGMSVLGFICLASGVAPWVLALRGRK